MLALRADPWSPEYGMGFDAPLDETPAHADHGVERSDWSVPVTPDGGEAPPPMYFVDGVRRVDLRLLADEGGERAPGLFGSFAVGCVRSQERAVFADHLVGHAVIVGGGLRPSRVQLPVGTTTLVFEPHSEPGSDPDRPLWGLQDLMRKAEGAIAARAAAAGDGVVVVDGPLTFADPTASPVVGVIKRTARTYLEPAQEALIAHLAPGQRTPLFGIGQGQQPMDRFSWYTRLAEMQPTWHDHAGVVRCEVREGVGLEAAVRLADQVSVQLPRFAGRPSDPRAPQNLAPVGALEQWLKHRLGHAGVVRRALVGWLTDQLDVDGPKG